MSQKEVIKVSEIISHYFDQDYWEYAIHNEIGKTMENYIKQIKIDEAEKAIRFTLKYLKEKNNV